MIRLRKILLFKYIYYVLFILSLIYVVIYNNINFTSKYKGDEKSVTGQVQKIEVNNDKITFTIFSKEKLLATYYIKDNDDIKSVSIGDKVKLYGNLSKPQPNNNFYSFSYVKYLKYKKIFYIFEIDSFEVIEKNNNILYFLRQKVRDKISNDKVGSYIRVFFLGDDSNFNSDLKLKFQKLGISHLFALSGTQIAFLLLLFNKVFDLCKVNMKKRYFILLFIIMLYSLLIDSCSAIERALVFSFLFITNKTFDFNISPFNLILLAVSLLFFINPYYIHDIGFQYSTVISCILILFMKDSDESKLIELLKVSWVSFLSSLPISLYHFSYVNVLSVFYNLFYVPFINIVIFPLSIICFFVPKCSFLLEIFINFFEFTISFLSKYNLGIIVLKHVNLYFYIVIFIIIILYLYLKRKVILFIIIGFLLLNYLVPRLIFDDKIYFLDVGQGDSSLLFINNQSILIDTGGVMSFNSNNKNSRVNVIIQFLYKIGINKLDYLIITHGDYDHMGEAINLVENFKVEKVIFNCGEFNELEKELIKVLDKKKIPYYSCIKELNIDDNKLFFLNNKDYDNENDNSSVIYTKLNNYNFLFMGDAGVEVEEDLIVKYSLENIEVLKVGHHGSRTSSSEEFINEIKPKYSIISVGKNNRYGHPNKEVLDNLKDSKTYRTDQDGSIMLKIKNNKLKVETCSP